MNSRNDTTTFLPLDFKIGGQTRDSPTVGQYLTRDQTRSIYKKVETGEMINTDTMQQEIKQEKQLGRIDNTSGETNPYKELIVNNAEKKEPLVTNGTVVNFKKCFKLCATQQIQFHEPHIRC